MNNNFSRDTVRLRNLDLSDMRAIIDLLQGISIFQPDQDINQLFLSFMQQDNITALVADVGGEIVGFGTYILETKVRGGTVAHIEDIVCKENYRGFGIGRVVVESLISHAQKRGCYKVTLQCKEYNVGFYEALGLTESGITMQMILTSNTET